MTPAEIFLELLKPDGQPERQLKQYEALHVLFMNPMDGYLRRKDAPGTRFVDDWGTTFDWPAGDPGRVPHITADCKALPDITRWREFVHAPDLEANCRTGWEGTLAEAEQARAKGKLATFIMGTGIFEQLHFLMGFEDTLTGFYEHPTEMHELIDYILEYRMTYVKIAIEELHPDAVLSHDDWGSVNQLFMKPEIWREFFKEPYRKFYGYIRSQGVITVHHGDSFMAPIVEDMAEIGIQVWQGVLPENDIPALQERLKGSMVLMGGVSSRLDRADSTEEEISAYMEEMLEQNCPGGHFIPCITYGAPGSVFKHVDPFINAAIEKYNSTLHVRNYRPAPVRRVLTPVTAAAETVKVENPEQTALLEQISATLRKGQKKRTVRLCEDALKAGLDAQTILNSGLMDGMTKLGDDFSANRVFVPEMLMAARCMSAATDLLKPYLSSGSEEHLGRVALGTVRGDMHDIGKNLVKIMMEGSGIEVIDLGVDVPAETFIQTAVERDCSIICCSSLLTTSMGEMRRVVQLVKDRNLSDRVTVMIGGAATSQSYCDEIGADIYTSDAASAARRAAEVLKAG